MHNAVITYIFGPGNYILREPLVIDPDIEYICVTDNTNLHSDTWNIIYSPMPHIASPRDKVAHVKLNPFQFTSARNICVIDGALQIKSSMVTFFAQLENGNDILLKPHPHRSTLYEELYAWKSHRGLPDYCIDKFRAISAVHNISLSDIPVYEGCVIGFRNNPKTTAWCDKCINYMQWLGNGKNMIATNQCVISLMQALDPINVSTLNQKQWFTRYNHGNWNKCDW